MKKHLQVSAIKDGTVIDHIPAKDLFDVLTILNFHHMENPMTFGSNLESKKLGKKAIIKISGKFFKDEEINKIALLAPHAKLNIIRDYKVSEKKEVVVPDKIKGIVKCVNPKCITNNENVTPTFTIVDKIKVALKCDYCERITDKAHMEML